MSKKKPKSNIEVKGYYILVRVDDEAIHKQLKPGQYIKDGKLCTESGIIIESMDEEQASRASRTGVVMQLGDLAYKTEEFATGPWCEVGDTIFFKRYDGINIDGDLFGEKGGTKYLLLNDSAVVAIIHK